MVTPTIFLGPPGTGKTTKLLDTVDLEMERGVPPDKIGFMTFTKRGVEEAVGRAATRFNLPRSKFRYFNTLHSAAFRHLGLSSSQVFTGKNIRDFGKEYGYDFHGSLSDDGTYNSFFGDDLVLFFENYSRITQRPIENILAENDFILPDYDRAWRCIINFRKYKQEKNLYDFTDMLQEFVKTNDPPRLEVLIIDEAQDLSELQWAMVFQLARHVKRMYIAGDDDQTIFTWAGASERFITMPGDVQILNQSHRVPRLVHGLATRVINRVMTRRDKPWMPRQENGSISNIMGVSELNSEILHSNGSVMMLGRTVKLIRKKYISYCRSYGLLYQYFDSPSIKPPIARAIDAWERLKKGQRIPVQDAIHIYDLLPSEGHAKKPGVTYGNKTKLARLADQPEPPDLSFEQLKFDYGLLADGTWDEIFVQITNEDKEYFQKILDNGYKITDKPNIHISTIHRVKGGQADTVVLLSETAKASDRMITGANSFDEETRIFYTGITRTYQDLILVQPDTRRHFGGLFE